mgnify:FL=1
MVKLDLLFLLVGLFFYIIFLYSFTKEKKTLFFVTCCSLIILHDFIFINLSYYTSELVTFILKAWQEYLTLFLVFLLLKTKSKINKDIFFILLMLIGLSFYGIILSVVTGMPLKETILSWRMYLLPILLPCLVYLNDGFKNVNTSFFYKYLKTTLFILVLFALYQNLLFKFSNGEQLTFLTKNFRSNAGSILKKTLWFYEYFGDDHILSRWFNVIRNGNIRATSFFVSPIIFAQFLGVIGSILMGKFIYSKRKINVLIMLAITFLGIYLAQVRAGFIFFIITFFIIYSNRKTKIKNYVIIGLPLFLVGITFIGLIFFKVGDASTVGRLKQYTELFKNFNFFGLGLGSYRAIINYDSLIISAMFAFGLFSIFYFKLHLNILKSMNRFHQTILNEHSFLAIGLLGAFSAFVYISFFHYNIGSAPIRFFYFIAFYYLYKNYEIRKQ